MSDVAVTVVLPTHNRSEFIGRAMRSVLAQTFTQFRLVIVDDCSTDNTSEVVASFGDNRVNYIRHSKNQGVSAARNTGVRSVSTPWVVFLDSDDEMLPTLLEKVSDAIKGASEEVGFLWCGIQRVKCIDGRNEVLERRIWSPKFSSREEAYRHFLKERRFGSSNGFSVRVNAYWDVGGFDERLRNAEDTDLFLRLAQVYDYLVIEEILINLHAHTGPRVSRASLARARGYQMLLKKNRAAIMADRETAHDFYKRISKLYYGIGRYKKARQYGTLALGQLPADVPSWVHLAKSCVAPFVKRRAAVSP